LRRGFPDPWQSIIEKSHKLPKNHNGRKLLKNSDLLPFSEKIKYEYSKKVPEKFGSLEIFLLPLQC